MKILFITRKSSVTHRGGDIVQIEKTAHFLRQLNCEVFIINDISKIDEYVADIIHITGINLQINLKSIMIKVKGLKYKPLIVMSSIYLSYEDYERNVRKNRIINLMLDCFGYKKLEFLKEMKRNKAYSLSNFYYFFFRHEDYFYKKYLNIVDLFLPNSSLEKEAMLDSFSISERKLIVIPNGIDFKGFAKPEHIPFENFVLCVARIEELKNQINLVRACKKVNKNLILIGNLPRSQSKFYQSLFEELDAERIYIGEVEHEKLSTYYSNCCVHALVSYFETCGLTTLEAVSFNKNIVISEAGYVRSYYGDEATYCDPYNVDSIANALVKACNKKNNFKFSEDVRKTFSWQGVAKQTLAAYRKALSEK